MPLWANGDLPNETLPLTYSNLIFFIKKGKEQCLHMESVASGIVSYLEMIRHHFKYLCKHGQTLNLTKLAIDVSDDIPFKLYIKQSRTVVLQWA